MSSCIAGLLGCWTISTLLSPHVRVSAVASLGFVMRGFIPAWTAYTLGKSPGQTRRLIHFIVFVTTLCALLGLYEWCRGQGSLFGPSHGLGYRIYSTVGHPLPLSCLLLLVLPLTLVINNKAWRLISFSSIVICLLGTVSRSSWAIALLSLVVIVVALPRDRSWLLTVAVAGIGSTIIFLTVWMIHNPASAALWRTLNAQRLSEAAFRHDLIHSHRFGSYLTTWWMLKERPVWGGGVATFPFRYVRLMSPTSMVSVPSPDNLYLRILADTGVAGFAAFIGLLIFSMRQAYRQLRAVGSERKTRLLIFIGLCSALVSSFFFDSFFWPSVLVPFSILIGLSQALWPALTEPEE